MDDAQLAHAAVVHFGGRARAAHILTCDECRHDDAGDFVACRRCPASAKGDRGWVTATVAVTKVPAARCTTTVITASAAPTADAFHRNTSCLCDWPSLYCPVHEVTSTTMART